VESTVIFRDYQEQQAQDHNDLQGYAQRSFDHIVLDAVTADRRYAGFVTTKTGQTEVQVTPGRMYDLLGVVYNLSTTTTLSMVSYLAPAYQRYLLLSAVGTEVETDIEERDYLTDVTSGATEPRSVATTLARAAVLTLTQGNASADPQKPAVPVSQVAIAYILLDTTQVVSVEMVEDNRVTSTDSLDLRTDELEEFEAMIGPKVAALASDLADLRNRINALGTARSLQAIAMDIARVKATLRYPVIASDYATDWFLDELYSDTTDALTLGYNARVEEGCRFGWENMDEFEISLFSANDPNASYSNGVLLQYRDLAARDRHSTHARLVARHQPVWLPERRDEAGLHVPQPLALRGQLYALLEFEPVEPERSVGVDCPILCHNVQSDQPVV
jgi:hypothetical protein